MHWFLDAYTSLTPLPTSSSNKDFQSLIKLVLFVSECRCEPCSAFANSQIMLCSPPYPPTLYHSFSGLNSHYHELLCHKQKLKPKIQISSEISSLHALQCGSLLTAVPVLHTANADQQLRMEKEPDHYLNPLFITSRILRMVPVLYTVRVLKAFTISHQFHTNTAINQLSFLLLFKLL